MSDLSPLLRQRFFTQGGLPLAGGLLYSYIAGTTTPLQTFTDSSGVTPMTNPIVLDANGETSFWIGSTAYKFVLQDSLGVVQWSIDNVRSLAAQIAAAISTAGALAVSNNLSDVASVAMSLFNLNISPFTYRKSYSVTSGQAATILAGETFDASVYAAVVYEFLITQGTTIGAHGKFTMININGTWSRYEGELLGTVFGIVFSHTQSTTIGQLLVAETGGLGNGTLLLKKHYFFA